MILVEGDADGTQIQQSEQREGRKDHARNEGGNASQRRFRKESEEPQASHCDRALGGAPRRQKGAEEKIQQAILAVKLLERRRARALQFIDRQHRGLAIIGVYFARAVMLDDFIQWLGATPASLIIQKVFWIIPMVQTLHILAISVLLASMAMFDLRLMGLAGRRHSVVSLTRRFMPWLWGSLLVLAISGSILIVGEPNRALGNIAFLLKMCMLAAAICLTLGFRIILRRDLENGGMDLAPRHSRGAKMTGLFSLVLWIGIAVAGRLIAYTGS
jgi:uncharacterized membrane protein